MASPGDAVISLPHQNRFDHGYGQYWRRGDSVGGCSIDRTDGVADGSGSLSCLRFELPRGLDSGYAPNLVYTTLESPTDELWMEYWFKYSEGFEFHPVATKQVYWNIASKPDVNNNLMLMVDGSQHLWINYQMIVGTGSGARYPNSSYNPLIESGVWYKAKVHIKLNTAVDDPDGDSNGVFQLWINDNPTPVIDFADIPYVQETDVGSLIDSILLEPIWGGSGGSKTTDGYFYLDNILVY